MSSEQIIGLLIVLFSAGGILYYTYLKPGEIRRRKLRKIPAVNRMIRAVSLSVEDGSRVHVSLGKGDLTETTNPSAIAGLDTLKWVAQLGASSDQPPVCTSGNGGLTLLSQDVLSASAGEPDARKPALSHEGLLAGVDPLSYALGTTAMMRDPGVHTNLLIGNYGPEAAFLTSTAENVDTIAIGTSDSITGQSVIIATTRDMLIGEELYAIPAYLTGQPAFLASLRVQDLLRLLIGAALTIGAVLGVLGIL